MSKGKYDFISDFLKDNKFSSQQRERFLRLVAEDFKSEDSEALGLNERVKKIEEFVAMNLLSNHEQGELTGILDKKKKSVIPFSIIKELPILNKDLEPEILSAVEWKEIQGMFGKGQPINQELTKNKIESNISDDNIDIFPTYISPNNVYKFLHAFNQSPILRTTCHLIDKDDLEVINRKLNLDSYKFSDHLTAIINTYDILEKSHYVSGNLKSLMRGYITGKNYQGKLNPWSLDKINASWGSESLIEWARKNEGVPPNIDQGYAEDLETEGFVFQAPLSLKTKNTTIQTFSELTLHFKSLFHINESNSLFNLIIKINEGKGWTQMIDFVLEDDFWKNQELFTDVEKIQKAYEKLISLILEKSPEIKPRVRISFKSENQHVLFSIHHLNSVYAKTLDDTISRGIGNTYNTLIENQINGFCDFFLRADFGHQQFAEVELWSKNSHSYPLKKKGLKTFEGVEHIMLFKK